MPRTPRKRSESGYYHVIHKGCNGMILFESDGDREHFLRLIESKIIDAGIGVIAWCLMGNHTHLILDDAQLRLSEVLRSFGTAYARYLNDRMGRMGPVFKSRYFSVAIEDDAQLLAAVRYVHLNPEHHGLCAAKSYAWSSYGEYAEDRGMTSRALVYGLLGGPDQFISYMEDGSRDSYFPRVGSSVLDDDALRAAMTCLGGVHPSSLQGLPVQERDEKIALLAGFGLSRKQIKRLTGLGSSVIGHALNRARCA